MKTRGVLLARLFETLLLLVLVITFEKTDTGLLSNIFAFNLDFTYGIAHSGSAMLLSTRLFGYLMSFVGTMSQADIRPDPLVYFSLILAVVGTASNLSETLRALGLVGVSFGFGCSALVVMVDWALYARLRRAFRAPTEPESTLAR